MDLVVLVGMLKREGRDGRDGRGLTTSTTQTSTTNGSSGTTSSSQSTTETPVDPTAVTWTLSVAEGNRLAGRVVLTSETTGELRMVYGPAGGDLQRSTPIVEVEAGVEREVYVLGLYPGDWDVAVSSGDQTGERQSLSTSVPNRYRPTTITTDNPVTAWSDEEAICASLEGPPSYVCTDRAGRPTAFISLPGNMMFVRALSDGTFLGHPDGPDYMVQFDVAGREIKRVRLDDLEDTTYQHGWIDEPESIEILEVPWTGHWAVLTATYQSGRVAQGIVVFDPDTLEVVWDWSAR